MEGSDAPQEKKKCYFNRCDELVVLVLGQHHVIPKPEGLPRYNTLFLKNYKFLCEQAIPIISSDHVPDCIKEKAVSFLENTIRMCVEFQNDLKSHLGQAIAENYYFAGEKDGYLVFRKNDNSIDINFKKFISPAR